MIMGGYDPAKGEIARDFRVTRQRVYQLISQFKKSGKYPTRRKTGRKPQPIDERTEALILESHRANNVGPTYLEMKIEETYGIHILAGVKHPQMNGKIERFFGEV